MNANVSMPMTSAPKPAASHAARGTAGHDAANADAAGEAGQGGFGHRFDQALKQQAATPVAGTAVPLTVPPKAALPQGESVLPPAEQDGDASTDPAERGGNALAAAVLALLGQGTAVPANAVALGGKQQGLSLDAGKGGGQHGASALMGLAAQGAATADAAAPAGIADATTLIAAATQAAAPDTHKSEQPASLDALAAPISPQTPGTNAALPAHALKMDAPAGSSAFAQELGHQVAWIGGQEIKQARIRLRPEELGQLDVKVSVAEHGRVDVSFTAQHPAAVTAVQQTLGQLDLMLAGHGLSLGQAQVGQQGGQGNGHEQRQAADDALSHDTEGVEPAGRPVALGLLDTFA